MRAYRPRSEIRNRGNTWSPLATALALAQLPAAEMMSVGHLGGPWASDAKGFGADSLGEVVLFLNASTSLRRR